MTATSQTDPKPNPQKIDSFSPELNEEIHETLLLGKRLLRKINNPKSNDVLGFQKEVHEWSQASFPHQTPESKFEHLRREIIELGEDLSDGQEMADCFLLLIGLAEMKSVDIFSEAVKKLEINKNRKWGKPDKHGVSSHVKE
jgi:NTP pyrophosphatase (non-canonical NTP hydrolase)